MGVTCVLMVFCTFGMIDFWYFFICVLRLQWAKKLGWLFLAVVGRSSMRECQLTATLGGLRRHWVTSVVKMSLVLRLPRVIHLCRSSPNVPRLPSCLKLLQNSHVWLTFAKAAKVQNPLRQPHNTTPERPKWSEHAAFLLFPHLNLEMRFATMPCTFSASQLPKALRSWGVLCIFTSKCALRHELPNVLRATAACIFSTSNLPKVLPQWGVLAFWLRHVLRALHATTACNVFSSLSWPDGSAPAALANLLFDPPEPQNIGKTQCVSRLFYFFAHFVGLLSSDFSSLTLPASAFPSVNIVGSLTSKLPSIILVAIACCHSLGVPCVVRQRSYICLYRYGCRGMNEFRKQKSLGTTNWNPAAFFDFPPFPALLSFWAMPVSRQIKRCMQMNAWLMTLWPYAGDCAIEFSLFLIFRAKPKNEMHQRISEC